MNRRRLRWGYQNVTGAGLSWWMRHTDVFMGVEARSSTLGPQLDRLGYRSRFSHASGLVIAWRPDAFRARLRDVEFRMFHGSGQAMGWEHIPTPRRGLLIVPGDARVGREWVPSELGVTHVLDSWMEHGEDDRRRIVQATTLPKLRSWAAEKPDVLKLLAGDFNAGAWDGDLPGLTPLHDRGLDRTYARVPDGVLLSWGRVRETRKVGVGPTRQHHGYRVVGTVGR